MDKLKPNVVRYLQIKEQLKSLMDEKKVLERTICETMAKHDVTTVELPDGKFLNYEVKESIAIKKDKEKEK
jgi:hypothetical protein